MCSMLILMLCFFLIRDLTATAKRQQVDTNNRALEELLLAFGCPVRGCVRIGRRENARSDFLRMKERRRSGLACTRAESHSDVRRHARPSPPLGVKLTRREVSAGVACGSWACCCCDPANALAAIATPPEDLIEAYDLPRDKLKDSCFALGMSIGMVDYEKAVAPTKKELFGRVFDALANTRDAVVVELGMGSFPNAPFYAASKAPLDIVGVDPNAAMEKFALKAATPLISSGSSVRVVHGVGEALPLLDNSVDVVVSTLTLCSVPSPSRTLAEIRRVLKPDGQFLFLEHVRSETDSKFAAEQDRLNPEQVKRADGCNLNRRTLETIRAAGFAKLDAKYFELEKFSYLNPTVAGIAIA